jgi:hypothetical protein
MTGKFSVLKTIDIFFPEFNMTLLCVSWTGGGGEQKGTKIFYFRMGDPFRPNVIVKLTVAFAGFFSFHPDKNRGYNIVCF